MCIYRRGGKKTSPPGKKHTFCMTPNMRNALPISTIIQLIKCIIRFWQECACLAQFQGSGRSRSGCTVTQIINMAELSRSGFVLFSLSPSLCLYHPLRDCPYLHSLLDSGGAYRSAHFLGAKAHVYVYLSDSSCCTKQNTTKHLQLRDSGIHDSWQKINCSSSWLPLFK